MAPSSSGHDLIATPAHRKERDERGKASAALCVSHDRATGLSPVTTEGDEVQMSGLLISAETRRHRRSLCGGNARCL